MSRRVLVFAPSRAGDDALQCTRWMADFTIDALQEDQLESIMLLDAAATRANLEAAASSDAEGLAFFSHGRAAYIGQPDPRGRPVVQDDAIAGADHVPALDRDNLHITRGRWVHAIACHAGVELGAQAVHHGAVCFVGYDCALIVEWEPGALAAEVAPLMARLVTVTTRNLARGVRDPRALRRAANEIAEQIADWCTENPVQANGLEAFAQQLVNRLCYFPLAEQ